MKLDLKRITAVGFQGRPHEENNPSDRKMLKRIKKSKSQKSKWCN